MSPWALPVRPPRCSDPPCHVRSPSSTADPHPVLHSRFRIPSSTAGSASRPPQPVLSAHAPHAPVAIWQPIRLPELTYRDRRRSNPGESRPRGTRPVPASRDGTHTRPPSSEPRRQFQSASRISRGGRTRPTQRRRSGAPVPGRTAATPSRPLRTAGPVPTPTGCACHRRPGLRPPHARAAAHQP